MSSTAVISCERRTWATDMTSFLQNIIEGIANGAIYGTFALALVLIHQAARVVNFAQGEMATFCTFVGWQLHASGLPWPLAVVGCLVFAFILGGAVERVVIRRFRASSEQTLIIVTLGMFVAFNGLSNWFWTPDVRQVPSLFPGGSVDFAGLRVTYAVLGTLIVTTLVAVGLYLLLHKTRIGLRIRGVASNLPSSEMLGIRVNYVRMVGWALASALGALAGILVAPMVFLEQNMMFNVMIYAFAGAVLTGFHDPFRALLGAIVIGVTENLVATYVPFVGSDLKIVVALLLIFAVLVLRPQGLFGKAIAERA